WIALGTGASRELAAFARLAERRSGDAAEERFRILCLDTDAPPEAFVDERGVAEERFIALSGFAPRRHAGEALQEDPPAMAWLAGDAFDRLPREYLHESPARTRVLGRLAYERARAEIRKRIGGGASRVGIALEAGGGMGGAIAPLFEDLLAS